MLKTIIVDDERKARDNLRNMLGHYCPQVNILADFGKTADAQQFIANNPLDGLFLDIQMPGMSGFDLLEKIDYHHMHVVFVTAFSDYAIKAFKAHALDYLLKPIKIDDLENAVARMEQLQAAQRAAMEVDTYQASLKNLIAQHSSTQPSTKLTVPDANGFKIIDSEDIVKVSADGAYSQITFQNGDTMLVSKNLGHFEDVLDSDRFVRVHYSHLINLNFLQEFSYTDGGTAIMQDGSKILVAKRRLKAFKEKSDAFYR